MSFLDTLTGQNAAFSNDSDSAGRRVRLRPKPGGAQTIYGNGILKQLKSTNGMVWPYQPTIQYSQEVAYTDIAVVHTNQDMLAYSKTHSVKLTVDGQFTVQNQTEGLYAMACIHFLRTVTKMDFGRGSETRGTPPPVLLFDAYGRFMFDSVPVVVTNFGVTLPNDVDYVPVDTTNLTAGSILGSLLGSVVGDSSLLGGLSNIYSTAQNVSSQLSKNPLLPDTSNLRFPNAIQNKISQLAGGPYVWLPAVFNISVQITTQHTPAQLDSFNINQFRNGTSLKSSGNLLGGISKLLGGAKPGGNGPGGWV